MRTIETHHSLEGYFGELLKAALDSERVELSEASTAYLIQVVSEFARRDALHSPGRADEPGTPTLVWLYERAENAPPHERFNAYRQMGDIALMVSGFFASHIERSLVDVDYYCQMGGAAYSRASFLARGGVFATVLAQLAGRFRRVVEVMTRMAEQTTLPVATDAGSLYARLLRNPDSNDLHARLRAEGLIPALRLVEA